MQACCKLAGQEDNPASLQGRNLKPLQSYRPTVYALQACSKLADIAGAQLKLVQACRQRGYPCKLAGAQSKALAIILQAAVYALQACRSASKALAILQADSVCPASLQERNLKPWQSCRLTVYALQACSKLAASLRSLAGVQSKALASLPQTYVRCYGQTPSMTKLLSL